MSFKSLCLALCVLCMVTMVAHGVDTPHHGHPLAHAKNTHKHHLRKKGPLKENQGGKMQDSSSPESLLLDVVREKVCPVCRAVVADALKSTADAKHHHRLEVSRSGSASSKEGGKCDCLNHKGVRKSSCGDWNKDGQYWCFVDPECSAACQSDIGDCPQGPGQPNPRNGYRELWWHSCKPKHKTSESSSLKREVDLGSAMEKGCERYAQKVDDDGSKKSCQYLVKASSAIFNEAKNQKEHSDDKSASTIAIKTCIAVGVCGGETSFPTATPLVDASNIEALNPIRASGKGTQSAPASTVGTQTSQAPSQAVGGSSGGAPAPVSIPSPPSPTGSTPSPTGSTPSAPQQGGSNDGQLTQKVDSMQAKLDSIAKALGNKQTSEGGGGNGAASNAAAVATTVSGSSDARNVAEKLLAGEKGGSNGSDNNGKGKDQGNGGKKNGSDDSVDLGDLDSKLDKIANNLNGRGGPAAKKGGNGGDGGGDGDNGKGHGNGKANGKGDDRGNGGGGKDGNGGKGNRNGHGNGGRNHGGGDDDSVDMGDLDTKLNKLLKTVKQLGSGGPPGSSKAANGNGVGDDSSGSRGNGGDDSNSPKGGGEGRKSEGGGGAVASEGEVDALKDKLMALQKTVDDLKSKSSQDGGSAASSRPVSSHGGSTGDSPGGKESETMSSGEANKPATKKDVDKELKQVEGQVKKLAEFMKPAAVKMAQLPKIGF